MSQNPITKNHIRNLVSQYFESEILSIDKVNNGHFNEVYIVRIKSEHDDIVIRTSSVPSKINNYLKEQWSIAKVKEKGLPVADVLEVNNEIIPFPYMIQKRVRGVTANEYEGDKEMIWKQMGQIASTINSIITEGFGSVFDWSQNILSKHTTWRDYMEKELNISETLELFHNNKILSKANLTKLQNNLENMLHWDFTPRLCHNDLLLKNVMVNNNGEIQYIIDWELAVSNKAPQFELAKSAYDVTPDERSWFLKGYGLTEQEFDNMLPEITTFNVLFSKGVLKYFLREKMKDSIDKLRTDLNSKMNHI